MMGANDDFVKIRVSKDVNLNFKELVNANKKPNKKISYREAYDEALKFFVDMNTLPGDYAPIAEQMKKETGRYISFFRVAEKQIYSKIDSVINVIGTQKSFTGSENTDVSKELFNISEVLRQLYSLIRLGFKLDLQAIQLILGDEGYDDFEVIMKDFKETMDEIEK